MIFGKDRRGEVRKVRRDSQFKAHSVAFRVTEEEWQKLTQAAKRAGTSIPRITKQILFQKLGLRSEAARCLAEGAANRSSSWAQPPVTFMWRDSAGR